MRRNAFTIVELLVVVTIIGILMAMVLPAINSARAAARKAQCINRQSQIAKAIQAYSGAKGMMPPIRTQRPGTQGPGWDAANRWNWVHAIMAELGRPDLYNKLMEEPRASVQVEIPLLVCPSDPPSGEAAPLSFVANAGRANVYGSNLPVDWPANGAMSDTLARTSGVELPCIQTFANFARGDGASTTLLLSENINVEQYTFVNPERRYALLWDSTGDSINENLGDGSLAASDSQARPSSRHPGGAVAAFVDGNVRFLNDGMEYQVYALLMTSNGRKAKQPGVNEKGDTPEWQSTRFITESDLTN